ncbi:uncharacterized protein [Cicer arietinum]|uniref:Uncharacterized protein LOC101505507 isoform X1 n=1 Tax=Cicer arietinum TaxID=3827 RepID=A0A1S2XR85_CICAR|nr:uncharacterized protein LOC101505507 isoform X1 [Cicer arietinum]
MKFYGTDLGSILQCIKRSEKQIKLKKRWLLGLPATKLERKKLKEILNTGDLAESLLRKDDDIFYESVRTRVERAFGAHSIETENCIPRDDMDLNQIPNLKRLIVSCLDNLTTKGLYLLAMIVSGGTTKYERTRVKLKKIIKGSLSSVLNSKEHNNQKLEICKQIFQHLNNPQHFRHRCELLHESGSQSYHAAVIKVLCELEKLPSESLIAMRRKLKDVKAPVPQLQPFKDPWSRSRLLQTVNRSCRKMLLQLDRGNELQEPLAKAMSVAYLSLKLKTGFFNKFLEEFYQFSTEVKSLQSDIINAIRSIEEVEVVPLQVLKDLQLLIEPKATISNKGLRPAFRNLLTEFLFECSDMDSTPKSLLQILDVINKSSNSSTNDVTFQKKYIDEEVDCILSVSAQTNQIIQDLLPNSEFDQDFTDAYMEQSEESDDSDSDEDENSNGSQLQENRHFENGAFSTMYSNCEGESVGDFTPFEFHPPTTITEPLTSSERLNSDATNLELKNCNTPYNNQCQEESTEQFSASVGYKNYNSSVVSPDKEPGENIVRRHDFYKSYTEVDPKDASNFCEETEPMPTKYNACNNQYLATQDACDKTAMLAYNLIGDMLKEFAATEGLNLNISDRSYLNHEAKETEKQSLFGKHRSGPAIVRVVEELIPSFPDSSMERLKVLMGL